MADAEVIIAPEVDRTALKKMDKDFKKSFKKVSDDAEKQIEKGVTKGIKQGAKKGNKFLNKIGGAGRKGFDSIGGARGMAKGAAGLALAGFITQIDRAQGGQDLISALLGGSTAAGSLSHGKAAGLTSAQLGQFSAQVRASGGANLQQVEIDDLLSIISIKAEEGKREQSQLSEFSHLNGSDRLNSILASLAQLNAGQAEQQLDEMGISGEASAPMLRLVEKVRAQGDFEAGKSYLETSNKSEGQIIADNLEKEATLANSYRDKQLKFNEDMRTKFLDKIGGKEIDAVFSGLKTEGEKQVGLIEGFVENQKTAVLARESLELALKGIEETMQGVMVAVQGIKSLVERFIDEEPAKTAEEVTLDKANSSRNSRRSNIGSNR